MARHRFVQSSNCLCVKLRACAPPCRVTAMLQCMPTVTTSASECRDDAHRKVIQIARAFEGAVIVVSLSNGCAKSLARTLNNCVLLRGQRLLAAAIGATAGDLRPVEASGELGERADCCWQAAVGAIECSCAPVLWCLPCAAGGALPLSAQGRARSDVAGLEQSLIAGPLVSNFGSKQGRIAVTGHRLQASLHR
jgi:hypothetical protein